MWEPSFEPSTAWMMKKGDFEVVEADWMASMTSWSKFGIIDPLGWRALSWRTLMPSGREEESVRGLVLHSLPLGMNWLKCLPPAAVGVFEPTSPAPTTMFITPEQRRVVAVVVPIRRGVYSASVPDGWRMMWWGVRVKVVVDGEKVRVGRVCWGF